MNFEVVPQIFLPAFTAVDLRSSEFGGKYQSILFADILNTAGTGGGGGGGSESASLSQYGLSTFASVMFAG